MVFKRFTVLLALCIAALAVSATSQAQSLYNVQVLPEGAFALNEAGQVAMRTLQSLDGYGNPYYNIQIWQDGSTTTLGTELEANGYDINNSGQVVGRYSVAPSQNVACVWSASGRTDIASGESAVAVSINDAGYIAGTYGSTYDARRAFVWDGGTVTDLTPQGAINSQVYGINNSNQITGTAMYYVNENLSQGHPVLWNNGEPVFLDSQGFEATCGRINNAGQILGYQWDPANMVSVLWTNGEMVSTSGPEGNGWGYGLNDSGQVVGGLDLGTGQRARAFLWQDGNMIDLNSVLPTGSSYFFEIGHDINNSGQILVSGWHRFSEGPMDMENCSFLLTPVPEPSSLLALSCGIMVLARSVVRRRAGS